MIAETIGRASVTAEFLDRWRAPGETTSNTWEERFALGEYLPGERLPSERDLAVLLGVSRSTIRATRARCISRLAMACFACPAAASAGRS